MARVISLVVAAVTAIGVSLYAYAADTDDLWFVADFDNPVELDGALFEQDMREGSVVGGRFGNGYRFSSDKARAANGFWHIEDPERLKGFPFESGTFVCWFQKDDSPAPMGALFSFCGFWQYQWVFSIFSGCTTAARGGGCGVAKNPDLGTGWHHFAATWNESALTLYFDGRRVAEKANPERTDMRTVNRAVLRFGVGGNGRPAFGGVMDEIAIFKRSLSADEVAGLAGGDKPIRSDKVELREWDAFPNVAPPPERDAFIVHSWGGSRSESIDFRKAIGINCVNVRVEDVATARRCAEAGFWLNLRIENSGSWSKYAPEEIARRVKTLVRPYKGLANWRMTLVNSEVYHPSSLGAAMSNEQWRANATRALGYAPEAALKFTPPALDYGKLGCAPFDGILPEDCASLNTLNWYLREGNPAYAVNRIDAAAIRAIRPDVTVWSEPTPSACGLDMLADWMYDYGTDYFLLRLRERGSRARGDDLRFMPTLSGSYHHSWAPVGVHPSAKDKDGKPLVVNLAQSCDETMIKAWMMLGAAKTDAMSIFNACAWEDGATNALAFAADPATPVRQVAETDFANRFGRFMHDKFLPAAERLKSLPTTRAKVALIFVDDCLRTGTEAWRPEHYRRFVGTCLVRGPLAFDVITEIEMSPEVLSKYKYVFLPMLGNGISKAHYDALCAVSNTTKVVTDGYCTVAFPNVEKLGITMPYWWSYFKSNPLPEKLAPLTAWLEAHAEELRREQFAWSDRDGKDAFTFVKEMPDGGKVVMVVNDKREDRSLWPQFCTDPRYRAIAAPNRVVLHVNLPGGEKVETLDLAPAEAKILTFN